MNDRSGPVQKSFFRWVVVGLDGTIALIFLGKGAYYALLPQMQEIGSTFALVFFLAHVAIAVLMVLAAVLVAKRRRGARVVQSLAFLVILTIMTVSIFFNPARNRSEEAPKTQTPGKTV